MKNELLLKQYASLVDDTHEELSILANTSAFIKQFLEDVSWAGFYLYKNDQLILGPFQGNVACTTIPMGKGVCGHSASKQETIIVENVHAFKGHIACDSASNSEIVVPIVINQKLYGVLDLDSTSFDRFHIQEQQLLEELVQILIDNIKKSN